MSDVNEQAPQQNDAPVQAENKAPVDSTEISALARHREAMKARVSPPQQEQQEADGQPQPTVGQQAPEQPQREPYIPRERFDEVLKQRDTLQQQISQFQQYMQQQQQPQVGPTGMVQPQQQATPQQQREQVKSFVEQVTKDPTTRAQWQKRIANEGVSALAEFVTQAFDAQGRALADEYARAFDARLMPLQRSLVQQQLSTFASQRASDPEFQVARPVFDNLVNTAAQRGYDVTNPQVLTTIEFLAKQAARQNQPATPQQPQMPQVTPFSERPGNAGQGLPRPQVRQLTPQERSMAERFGMSPEQYLGSLRAMGVEQ